MLQELGPLSASEAMGADRREVATAAGEQLRRLPPETSPTWSHSPVT
ncbi:hypothetical protein ACFSNO_27565 [Streptomyces cirratus]